MNEPDEYLSTAQVASMYRVSERVVRNWCSTGRIQAVRSGGVWHILRAQFSAGPEEVRNSKVSKVGEEFIADDLLRNSANGEVYSPPRTVRADLWGTRN